MKYSNKLFSYKKAYDLPGTDGLFVEAMRENCRYHYDNNEKYKKILDAAGFNPDMIQSMEDLEKLPIIPTAIFKKHDLNTKAAVGKSAITVTSSGTSGKRSTIKYDLGTLFRALKMAIKVTKTRKLISFKPTHYIVLGYKPHKGNQTAVTKTAYLTTLLAPAIDRFFALKVVGKNSDGSPKYEPDLEGVVNAIIKNSKSKSPTRLMGFPSYTYFAMEMLEGRDIQVKLPEGSKILLGGGWKQFYKEKVDKETFYALAEKTLGIKEENIVEFFGAAEHAILYCDCKNHHFHVPVYGRVIIRDVNTMEAKGIGEPGLINLLTPLVKSAPVLSIMTDDIGVLRDGSKCDCGLNSPYLEIIGRVGLKDIMTCAAGAEKIIQS